MKEEIESLLSRVVKETYSLNIRQYKDINLAKATPFFGKSQIYSVIFSQMSVEILLPVIMLDANNTTTIAMMYKQIIDKLYDENKDVIIDAMEPSDKLGIIPFIRNIRKIFL